MRRLFLFTITILALTASFADAHRSGCHRWHSCPSDRGTYACGDTGYCSQCPDNEHCTAGQVNTGGRHPIPAPRVEQLRPISPDLRTHSSILTGSVVGVADGDTLTILTGDRKEVRIRLAEIDAPEKGQPFGQRSKQSLSDLVFDKEVQVHVQTTDRYGRTVGRVFIGDLDVNLEQIKRGVAWVYRTYSRDSSLLSLEEDAKAAKRGLWSEPNPTPPWDFRRAARDRQPSAQSLSPLSK